MYFLNINEPPSDCSYPYLVCYAAEYSKENYGWLGDYDQINNTILKVLSGVNETSIALSVNITNGGLNVTVINKNTNSTIFGASVQLYGPNSSTFKDTKTTDSNGNVSFSNLQQGDYYLYITKSGYYEKFTNFYTITNSSYDMGNIYLTPLVSPVAYTLTAASSNPNNGVYIYISPNDNNSLADGITQFTRIYDNGMEVTLIATSTTNGNIFSGWSGCDSTSGPSGTFCFVTMNTDKTVTATFRSEEHTSELQSHSFISYAVFCLKKKNKKRKQ